MKFGSINIFLWSLIKIIFVLLLLLLLISTIYLKNKLGVNLYRYSYYLIDQEYLATEDYFTMGHLIIFNPGIKEAKLKVTIFFEDKDSEIFYLDAPAQRATETNYKKWPVKPNSHFALKVESTQPIVCQSTNGWYLGKNISSEENLPQEKGKIREIAKSYSAVTSLDKSWYLADGNIIDQPIKESEWLTILNPNKQNTEVTLKFYKGENLNSLKDILKFYLVKQSQEYKVNVSAGRLKRILMDNLLEHNFNYGLQVKSGKPIVAQWSRYLYWLNSSELMSFWSIPLTPESQFPN